MIRASIPILRCISSVASEAYYTNRLGFEKGFEYRIDPSQADPCYMGFHRDGVWIHVTSFPGDGQLGSAVYLIVDDVDTLHADFVDRGIEVDLPPTDQSWGNRELYLKDPDGNSLRFVVESTA